jgi:uncharacterized membrane protein YjjP (DUF1212 family)
MYLVTTDQNGCITKNARKYGVHQCVIYIQSEMFLLPEEMRNEPVGFKTRNL